METTVTSKPKDLSRRVFFQRAATLGVGAAVVYGLGSNLANAQAKVPQKTVSYQGQPKGEQRCDACSNFQAPKGCKMVEGEISPQGWCSLFTKKA